MLTCVQCGAKVQKNHFSIKYQVFFRVICFRVRFCENYCVQNSFCLATGRHLCTRFIFLRFEFCHFFDCVTSVSSFCAVESEENYSLVCSKIFLHFQFCCVRVIFAIKSQCIFKQKAIKIESFHVVQLSDVSFRECVLLNLYVVLLSSSIFSRSRSKTLKNNFETFR